MAGVAIDELAPLATPESVRLAGEIAERRETLHGVAAHAASHLSDHDERTTKLRSRLARLDVVPSAIADDLPDLRLYVEQRATLTRLEANLQRVADEERLRASEALRIAAQRVLPAYLVFSRGPRDNLIGKLATESGGSRRRATDRRLLLYMQRVCTKNETFSAFGPSAWGYVHDTSRPLVIEPDAGIARRNVLIEAWVASAVAAAISDDPEARPLLAPVLGANVRIVGEHVVDERTGETCPIEPAELEILRRCDGATRASAVGSADALDRLAQKGIVSWRLHVPAYQSNRLGALRNIVAQWPQCNARTRWLGVMETLLKLADQFASDPDVVTRERIMRQAESTIAECGLALRGAARTLYRADNAIVENCARTGVFLIGKAAAEHLTKDAAPWFDLYRDSCAYARHVVATSFGALLDGCPRRNGRVSLSAFLAHAANNGITDLSEAQGTIASRAFAEVQKAFLDGIADRAHLPEIELSQHDCHVVRRTFTFPRDDRFWPSADLQVIASSLEAVVRGEYQWLIAELHPFFVPIQHALAWHAPSPEELKAHARSAADSAAQVAIGDPPIPEHAALQLGSFFGGAFTFVGDGPCCDAVSLRPAEVDVYRDESNDDIRLRASASGRDLGSLCQMLGMFYGLHPFVVIRGPHTPRLRLGNVVVQRRTWVIATEQVVPAGVVAPDVSDTLIGLHVARQRLGLPRWVFVRPSASAVNRATALGRDKDVKPIFVDLESLHFVDVLMRWFSKYGELEVCEMLPSPEQITWPGASDGARSYEIRTFVVPRS